ncbi:extracellular solute-binding protein [Chelatococcus asaccharovorans]|uniref:sn-glycerol-3-phosphate-binding periplasmic protein UgpB n=1 Tax=Chelatococcus asaccharovorans TaxID=28210 RepID=A0A2V3TVH4_9HYPH|nr:extracellular solute-binding protein [Chelatococcus asaccharovorans]MBS7702038.1 extracellular solute-binding protein [Chelatococcus asaccharovorans]PXW52808.1 multiple sugar transport system substrate-binding protein [Chelatococcus asaccharovorans]
MIRLLSSVALGAMIGAAPALAQTEIRIVSGQERQNGAVLVDIFKRFNAGQNRVLVDLELDNRSDLDTTQKVLADIVAGTTPDAVRITGAVLRSYIDSGRAQPLDACLASAPKLAAQLDTGLLDGFRVNGTLYAMPWYVTLPALFINADAFRAAGLDPESPPATWSELEAAAAALSNGSGDRYGLLMYMPNTYMFEGQLASSGGAMVGPDGQSGVAGPAAVDQMAFMRRLVKDKRMPALSQAVFWGEAARLFQAGEVAMLLTSSSSYNSLTANVNFDVALAPMPAQDGHDPITMASGNGFVMLATDPARQEATCSALLSLITPESVAATVRATASSPLNVAAAEIPELLGDFYAKNRKLVVINSQMSRPWYTLPGRANNEFQSNFGDIQHEILTGATSPQDGLNRLAALMNELNAGQ